MYHRPVPSSSGSTLSFHDGARRQSGDRKAEPHLVLALECSRPFAGAARYSLAGLSRVHLGRGREREARRRDSAEGPELDIRVPDRWMSSRHARLERSFGRWAIVDAGSKNGTRVGGEPAERHILADGDVIELGHTLLRFRAGIAVGPDESPDVDLGSAAAERKVVRTLVPEFSRELEKLERVAPTEISILLAGESGSGKEVLARTAHELSGRSGPFVAVNCGAIPEALVESELFGHKKGAFSGADQDRPGLVRSAHGGTLFLDEIGDLERSSQAALLRVLQEREVLPVGHHRPIPVDIRLVSATHQDLNAMVDAGAFRRDLFARIAGFKLRVPPLRERRDDLGQLIGTLLYRAGGAGTPGFEVDAARLLLEYDWPLNVRELETSLAAAAALAGNEPIACEHLPESLFEPRRGAAEAQPAPLSPDDARRRDTLVATLRETGGNISAAARSLEVDRKQIQRWLKRFEIDASGFRPR